MIKQLAHICIFSKDLVATEEFYCQALKLKKVFNFVRDNEIIGFYLQISDKSYIEVFKNDAVDSNSVSPLQHIIEELLTLIFYQEINNYLRNLADAEIASHSQRFFKTARGEYGFGDKFLGIRVPVLRKAVKKFKTIPLNTATKLLKSEFHEIRLFALLLLVSRFAKADTNEQEKIYQIYLRNTKYVNNWDLVDSSAHYIIGAYLADKDKSVLYDLLKSNSLWERRIAIMSTFYFIKNNKFDDALHISEKLLYDKEDLIHKAVGWMLREIGNRDLNVETAFLNKHYKTMPRVMLRYAIEKFSKEERQKYLKGKV